MPIVPSEPGMAAIFSQCIKPSPMPNSARALRRQTPNSCWADRPLVAKSLFLWQNVPMAKILSQQRASAAQCRLAASLFQAIYHINVSEVFRLAPLIEELDLHTYDDALGESPLLFAARHDLPISVFELLLPRSDPRKKNADNATALILAAWGSQPHTPDLIRLLLPLSDPMAVRNGGSSALHSAIEATGARFSDASAESISLLLPTSDLEQRNYDGRTPLELARVRSESAANLVLGEMARREAIALAVEISTAAAVSPAARGGLPPRL